MRRLFLLFVFIIFSVQAKEFAFEDYIKPKQEGENRVGLIKIDNRKTGITQSTWIYVKHALDYYRESKPIFIILELDTPGGEVYSAQEISDGLKEIDTQNDIPVVAFINNWAISAGAMLAYSSRFITVVKDGSMGAAEPVFPSPEGGMVSAPEKVNSALRTDFANRANFFDRDPNMARAMVDKDIIIVWRGGKVVELEDEDDKRATDETISKKGKLLTLSADELIKYQVANLELAPAKLEPVTNAEKTAGMWPASKMLLFQEPFFKAIPNATIDEYKMDWKIRFLSLLALPAVSSLLFLAMMIGFYVEINSPGFGFPGSIGLIALFLIILSSYALEVVSWLELILVLVGVVFIAIDLFAIPTFGILGSIGVLLTVVGLFGMMLPGIGEIDFEFDTQTFNAAGEVFMSRLAWLAGTFVVGCIVIALLGRYVMPKFGAFRRFVLAGGEQEGFMAAGAEAASLPKVGAIGKVSSTLRPGGKVLIEDAYFDAASYGKFIEKGKTIVVVEVRGSTLIVEDKE